MQASDPFGWMGSVIDGQFAIEALAGEGAFGVVYRGRHLGFDAPIAVKCLKIPPGLSAEQREEFLAKFREEARLLHQLSRRTMGIVRALDIGAAAAPSGPWTPYIVMEWLEGETLEQDLKRRRDEGAAPRTIAETMRLLGPVANALAVAHDQNVSHRDVKPANLFLASDITKVLDFGLAKVFTETPTLTEALAQTGRTFRAFTPQYGAPEQFSPRFGATGPWTDVYAMALIFVELATGEPALSGHDVIQLFVASSDETVRPSLRAHGVHAGADIEAVLSRAVAVNPANRFHSLGEMWAALEATQRAASIEVGRDTLRAPAFLDAHSDPIAPASDDAVARYVGARPAIRKTEPAGRAPTQRAGAARAPASSMAGELDDDAPPAPSVHVPRPPPLPSGWRPASEIPPASPASINPERLTGARGGPTSHATIGFDGGEHRVCTVLFADLSEVTGLSNRLDPEEVKDVVDRCYQVLAEQVDRMQGVVERPIGGRAMAVFGVPRSTDHDAERAIAAALAVQAAVPRLVLPRAARSARVALRIGITTGRVFLGAAGSGRQDVAIIGDAVDGAARLQQAAPRGAIVIGRDTHRLALGRFQVEPFVPAVPIGRAGSAPPAAVRASSSAARGDLPIYRVLGEAPTSRAFAPSEVATSRATTRLIGRGAEMQRLRDVVETSLHERRARIVTLVGAPGAGLTRMLADVLAGVLACERGGASSGGAPPGVPAIEAPAGGLLVMQARCSALARDVGYGLAASLIRRRFDVHEADPPEVVWKKLRRGLRWFRIRTAAQARAAKASGRGARLGSRPGARSDDDLEPVSSVARPLPLGGAEGAADLLASLAMVLGVQPPAPLSSRGKTAPLSSRGKAAPLSSWGKSAPATKHRTLAALFRLAAYAIERTPVVIVCDDLHWADDATLDLLDELAARADGLPLCVVCAARPDLYERRPGWGAGKEAHVRIDAPPLARRHVEEMIRDRLHRVPELRPEALRVLAERAEGSPRMLEEILQLLVDSGVIDTTDAAWRFHDAELGVPALPATVQGVVQARLDRLDAEARGVLAQAAVVGIVGRTFWEGAVERLRMAAPQGRSPVSSQRILAELTDLDPPFSVRLEDGAKAAQILARLCERQLIRARPASMFPGEREYVFVEQSTCEVAYEMLSLRARRRIHLLVADWLEQLQPQSDAGAELLGRHYDRGGDLRAAAAAYARAAAYAASIGEAAESERLTARVRALEEEVEAEEEQRPA